MSFTQNITGLKGKMTSPGLLCKVTDTSVADTSDKNKPVLII